MEFTSSAVSGITIPTTKCAEASLMPIPAYADRAKESAEPSVPREDTTGESANLDDDIMLRFTNIAGVEICTVASVRSEDASIESIKLDVETSSGICATNQTWLFGASEVQSMAQLPKHGVIDVTLVESGFDEIQRFQFGVMPPLWWKGIRAGISIRLTDEDALSEIEARGFELLPLKTMNVTRWGLPSSSIV